MMGLGFVIQIENGTVILTGTKKIKSAGNNTHLEALAMRFGLQSAREYGFRGLDLETDSQNLVRALRGNLMTDAYSRLIVGDILSMGGQNFNSSVGKPTRLRIVWH
ncbi:hypothetical protein ACS0TY_005958 [Phlomoides rotata]